MTATMLRLLVTETRNDCEEETAIAEQFFDDMSRAERAARERIGQHFGSTATTYFWGAPRGNHTRAIEYIDNGEKVRVTAAISTMT